MSPIPGKYKGYFCFENYWQAGKVFEGVNFEERRKWWKQQTKGKRRFPNSKGMKPLYAKFEGSDEK